MNKNAIVGYSGHAYVILDAARYSDIEVIGYFDMRKKDFNPFGLDYLGYESMVNNDNVQSLGFILGIGDNTIRHKIYSDLNAHKCHLSGVVHPKAHVSTLATIGKGVFISAGAMINAFAKVGDAVIINTGAVVEHECVVSEGAHIAPGAVLTGGVHVGRRSLVGANAVVKQGVRIGDDVIVGAGAVVLNDVADSQTVVGNPGKVA